MSYNTTSLLQAELVGGRYKKRKIMKLSKICPERLVTSCLMSIFQYGPIVSLYTKSRSKVTENKPVKGGIMFKKTQGKCTQETSMK